MAPFSIPRSKLNRAICAWLINQGVGSTNDTVPANSVSLSTYPNTTVKASLWKPEVQLTGLYRITTYISIKGSATKRTDEPNAESPRVQLDKRVAETYDALMQSDDGQTLRYTARGIRDAGRALAVAVDNSPEAILFAQNNADMADFTVTGWYDLGGGDGLPDEDGCSWEEILIFDAVCCSSNVD